MCRLVVLGDGVVGGAVVVLRLLGCGGVKGTDRRGDGNAGMDGDSMAANRR